MPTRHLRAVAGLTALAAILRLPTLGVQSFWLDESVTVGLVRRPLGAMLSALPTGESTPPLYYILSWAWSHAFGSSEVGLRSLSAACGIATVPVAYAIAVRLASTRVGVTLAALAATNPLLVWYSQEARAYALLTLLSALSLLLFVRLRGGSGRGALGAWAAVSALALATHYFAAFVVAPEAVWLALLWSRRGARPRLTQAAALFAVTGTGLALLPLALRQRANHSAAFIGKTPLTRRLLQVPKQDLLGFNFPHQTAAAIAALAIAAFGLWLLARRGAHRERVAARTGALLALPAVAIPLLLALSGADYFITRNLIVTWVPLAIVLATGLGSRRAGRAGTIATTALCALAIFAIAEVEAHPAYQRDDWRSLARALGTPSLERAIVTQPLGGHNALAVYLPNLGPLPAAGGLVREIDLVAVARRNLGGASTPPRPPSPTPPAGFLVVERRTTATFTLIRMRAQRSLPVNIVATLGPLRLESGDADYVFQAGSH